MIEVVMTSLPIVLKPKHATIVTGLTVAGFGFRTIGRLVIPP
jgi:hypothetical protein